MKFCFSWCHLGYSTGPARQRERKRGACGFIAAYMDPSAVLLGNPTDKTQPQPPTWNRFATCGAIEAFKQLFQLLLGNHRAGVLYFKLDFFIRRADSYPHSGIAVAVFDCVTHQVQKCSGDQRLIAEEVLVF